MSDLSEEIAEQRARTRRPPRRTSKHRAPKRALQPRGGIGLRCGCRWMYSGEAWRHVTPCKIHDLELRPATDVEMKFLAWGES